MINSKILTLIAFELSMLGVSASRAEARFRVEAYAGQPFGVAKATVDAVRGEPSLPLSDERFTIESPDGRVLYPVMKTAPVRKLLRQILEIEAPASVTMYFLFQGDGPLDLQAFTPAQQTTRVEPQGNPRRHQRLLDEWWDEYRRRWRDLRRDPQFPPVVENYVAATFARRLGKELPTPGRSLFSWAEPKLTVWDSLFTGEAYQLELDRKMLLRDSTENSAPEAKQLGGLPRPIEWPRLDIDVDLLADVAVEPISLHVPEECFYIRYGTFVNYLWFRDLNKKWQGDLQNMLERRSIDRAAADRIEQQLSLRESALAKVIGPQVIEDVAMIGLDPYLASGASVGILFQAKNNRLLGRDLNGQRQEALERFDDAKEEMVRIADHDVSLISNPAADVRSYYYQDGDYHLVATSSRLVERFIKAGQGERPLAANKGFLLARKRLPVDRNDTLFAHVSSAFFKQLCSPAVWIENQRRVRSLREMQQLELARLAAHAEGVNAFGVDELIDAGLLPGGFGDRADGSLIIEDERGMQDSLRGRPRFFTPIADMLPESATGEETFEYRRFADRFLQQVGQFPPLTIAAERRPLPDGAETMIVEMRMEPNANLKLGKLADALGPATKEQIPPTANDLAHFELVLDTQFALLSGENELHHLFGALQDFRSPLVVKHGSLTPGAPATELIRGYLGAWPRPGLLALFTGNNPLVGPKPEPLENDMFLAGRDDLLLISFKEDVIAEVLPQLARAPAERPAQARIDIRDLTGADVSRLINAIGYSRARETSVAASRFMNTLANQLHVDRPACRETAEQLVDGKMVCALDGEYQLFEPPRGLPVWISSALPEGNRFLLSEVPENYELPLLQWFRGLRGDLHLADDALSAHLELDMDRTAVPWQTNVVQPADSKP